MRRTDIYIFIMYYSRLIRKKIEGKKRRAMPVVAVGVRGVAFEG